MRLGLTFRLFGVEWLSLDAVAERDDPVFELVDPACVACEDSGDDCALCGAEVVELGD